MLNRLSALVCSCFVSSSNLRVSSLAFCFISAVWPSCPGYCNLGCLPSFSFFLCSLIFLSAVSDPSRHELCPWMTTDLGQCSSQQPYIDLGPIKPKGKNENDIKLGLHTTELLLPAATLSLSTVVCCLVPDLDPSLFFFPSSG